MTEGPTIPHKTRNCDTCKTCANWRELDQRKYAYAPSPANGQYLLTPIDDLRREKRLPKKAIQYNFSSCTALPQWNFTADFHYCGNYKARSETNYKEILK